MDNKAFNENKNKYANQSKKNIDTNQGSSEDMQGVVQENAWLVQKIEELSSELKKKTKEIHEMRKHK